MFRRFFCELVGTFFLVLVGTGAIIANDFSGGAVGHVGIAMSFGLVVMAIIYAIGDSSGAHLNPAVTIGFCVARRLGIRDGLAYILSQCLGAVGASLFLRVIFPLHAGLGATLPSIGVWQTFLFELVLTWFLMFVILSVATGAKEKGLMAGIAIGGTVMLEAMFAGPFTGASMNPARSLGPALISGQMEFLWIYLAACPLGAILAVPACRLMSVGECCEGKC